MTLTNVTSVALKTFLLQLFHKFIVPHLPTETSQTNDLKVFEAFDLKFVVAVVSLVLEVLKWKTF